MFVLPYRFSLLQIADATNPSNAESNHDFCFGFLSIFSVGFFPYCFLQILGNDWTPQFLFSVFSCVCGELFATLVQILIYIFVQHAFTYAFIEFSFDWFIRQIPELGGGILTNIYYKYWYKYDLICLPPNNAG